MHGVMPYGQCHEVEQNQKPASCGFFHGQAWFTRRKMPRKCHFDHETFTIHQPWLGSILSIIPYRGRQSIINRLGTTIFLGFTMLYHALPPHWLITSHFSSSKIPSPGRIGKILKDDDAFFYPIAQQNMIKHVSSCHHVSQNWGPSDPQSTGKCQTMIFGLHLHVLTVKKTESPGISRYLQVLVVLVWATHTRT